MRIDDDETGVALANRHFLYRYLWRAFAAKPDETLLEVARGQHALEACGLVSDTAARIQQAIAQLARADASADDVASLEAEYTRVLIGPASLPAPPWESVFATGENLIFQESTLAVRAAYRAAGYVAAGYPREADDHLATELDFMATLAEEACTAYEAGDAERAHASLQVQRQFLSEHLNTWAKPFSDRLERAAGKDAGGLYVHFAQLCAEVCAADEERVSGLMADA